MKGCREVLARLCAEVLPAAKGRVRHLGARRHTDAVKRHGSPKNRPPRNPVDTPPPPPPGLARAAVFTMRPGQYTKIFIAG